MLEDLQATVTSVTVTELRERTFAELTVAGQRHSISARSSDAIAIAVRTETPFCIRRSFS